MHGRGREEGRQGGKGRGTRGGGCFRRRRPGMDRILFHRLKVHSPTCKPVNQSVSKLATQLTNEPLSPSVIQSVTKKTNEPLSQSVNQSANPCGVYQPVTHRARQPGRCGSNSLCTSRLTSVTDSATKCQGATLPRIPHTAPSPRTLSLYLHRLRHGIWPELRHEVINPKFFLSL